MPFVVEKDEPFDPMNIAVLGLGTVVPCPNRLADLIEKFGSWFSCPHSDWRREPVREGSIVAELIYFGAFHVVSSRSVCVQLKFQIKVQCMAVPDVQNVPIVQISWITRRSVSARRSVWEA